MINLIDEEHQQGQHDHQQEAGAAGEELHHLAKIGKLDHVFAHNVSVGNHVHIGDGVVVALGHIAADAALVLNLRNPVGVQGELVVDDGVEGNNVALIQGGRVTLSDDNQVTGVEGGSHGIGHHAQGSEAGKTCHLVAVLGSQGCKGEQGSQQNHRPKENAD